jgi:enterochelin esterase-like enzyme
MNKNYVKYILAILLTLFLWSNFCVKISQGSSNYIFPALNNEKIHFYDFLDFDDFLVQYGLANETERINVLEDFISWQETAGGGFPAIQNSTFVVFIYYNPSQIIETCGIVGDFTAWNIRNMTNLDEGVSFFYYNYTFEPTSRIDYLYVIDEEPILDERNPNTCYSGFDFITSELAMPLFIQPDEIKYRSNITHGTLETLESPWSNPIVQVYLPPNYDDERKYSTLYAADGSSYTELMSMVNILDNLITDKLISPIIAIFVDPIDFVPGEPYDYMKRVEWYRCNTDYLDYMQSLVEYIDSTYSTNRSAYARCHLGYSISGLASTYIVLQKPNLFKLFASQSGSFTIGQTVFQIKTKYSLADESLNFKSWFSIGTYENNNNFGTPMVEDTEEMADICESKGWTTELVHNYGECHNYGQWRHCLDDMLKFFFPYDEYNIPKKTSITIFSHLIIVTIILLASTKGIKKKRKIC